MCFQIKTIDNSLSKGFTNTGKYTDSRYILLRLGKTKMSKLTSIIRNRDLFYMISNVRTVKRRQDTETDIVLTNL